MNVLALNPGSSSLRFALVGAAAQGAEDEPAYLSSGVVTSIGSQAQARAGRGGQQVEIPQVRARDHAEATAWVLYWLAAECVHRIDAVGVRFVHGGTQPSAGVLVEPAVERVLEGLNSLAPLHNAGSFAAIQLVRQLLPNGLPIAAVFDTAFHAGMPQVAQAYALPYEWTQRHGIRRFGFHGIAIESVLERYQRATKDPIPDERIVVLHLGSGASVTAVRGGHSIDTTMGFTPLEGLAMATRSGDLDPALIPYIAEAEGLSAAEVLRCLNQRSGLCGLSGTSGDMREIEILRAQGEPRASLAFDLFAYRAKKYLAAMIATLDGVDAVVFSGGIGENSAAVRAAICSGMAWCGIALDASLNALPERSGGRISAAAARVSVHVVPADEARIIARKTSALLADRKFAPAR